MKAVSLWQPWASAMAVGLKSYETRGWLPAASLLKPGEEMAICAAKTQEGLEGWDADAAEGDPDALALLSAAGVASVLDLPRGMVVAVGIFRGAYSTNDAIRAKVTEQEMAFGDWHDGRFVWHFTPIRRLRQPVPVRGAQGIFRLPDDVVAQVIAAGGRA